MTVDVTRLQHTALEDPTAAGALVKHLLGERR